MESKVTVGRDVTQNECSWLERDYKKGETLYLYFGATYGCIGSGRAVSEQEGETPFFEFPRDALFPVKG